MRAEPHLSLEEVDSDEVIVRIAATPESDADGPRLADEVLSAIASVTREGDTASASPPAASATAAASRVHSRRPKHSRRLE